MRSGPIQSEVHEERIDRREKELPLWEQGNGANIDLPWTDLNPSYAFNDVQPLVKDAHIVVLAIGSTVTSHKLLNAVLQSLPVHCRLYIYGDRALEADTAMVQRTAGMGDRVLTRLGPRTPADWLVVDKGREGRLVVGPTAEHQRWVIPVEGALARSLFEAFRVLFWFHAEREALPDISGEVSFQEPLAAPFDPPGTDVSLAAGRLRLDGNIDDPVPDAEIRISPLAVDPGRARVLFVPPTGAWANGGRDGPVDLDLPKALCQRGHRVLWVDTGLPRTTVTYQRMVMDLVEAPIALQVEWPRGEAINLIHALDQMAKQPDWEFHPDRRLDAVKGRVLLDRATQPAEVVQTVLLDAGDLDAPLLSFDSLRPARLPDIPPLALEATIRWQRVPAALPPDAHTAEIVRSWTAVDEWASRTVVTLRHELNELESQEGLLNKLRQWLPSRDWNLASEREQLRDELDEIGESRPSGISDQAEERMERLVRIVGRVDGMRRNAFNQQQDAEDAKAREDQRGVWEQRVNDANAKLGEARQKLAANEEAQGAAGDRRREGQATLDNVVATKRQERKAFLDKQRADLEAKLEESHTLWKSLKREHKGQRSKGPRKRAYKRVRDAERMVARNKQDRESLSDWLPPLSELDDVSARLTEAKKAIADLQADATRLSREIENFNRVASEEFRFDRPQRLPAPSTCEVSLHPPIPSEAPPEIGELYEFRGERFLAIRTWDQLEPAKPVAERLQAELVAVVNPS